MNDRSVALLEQYDIEVLRTRKGRGTILCDTNQGCMVFKEYIGNESKIILQDKLLQKIREEAKVNVDRILPTKEGELFVKDNDGTSYILKSYYDGRECNIYEKSECIEAVKVLALLHSSMILPVKDEENNIPIFSPLKEYEKHNRELVKVRSFLRKKSQKTWFEINLAGTFDYFLEQALEITEEWKAYEEQLMNEDMMTSRMFCHGDYQYHNIIKTDKGWTVINFEKYVNDNQIRDLYLLLRKLLEKGNWSISLGNELLEAYQSVTPINAISNIDLYYRLAYPEKFWKIVNFYFNSGKAWIPERNQETLEK